MSHAIESRTSDSRCSDPGRGRWLSGALCCLALAGLGPLPVVQAQGDQEGASDNYARHGDLSRRRLQIRWQTPAVLVDEKSEPMPRDEVLAELRGRDPRPILIRREGYEEDERKGDPLAAEMDRDEIRLMSHWFHCMRLGRRVMDEHHPYHKLFEGKKPAALIVASWDGTTWLELAPDVDKRELQAALVSVLKVEYRKDPLATVDSWLKILSRFDSLEQDQEYQEARKARAVEKSGEGTTKDKRAAAKLAAIEKEIDQLVRKEKRLQALGLRRDPKARTEIDFDAEAAQAVDPTTGLSDLERLKKKLEEQKKKGEPKH